MTSSSGDDINKRYSVNCKSWTGLKVVESYCSCEPVLPKSH